MNDTELKTVLAWYSIPGMSKMNVTERRAQWKKIVDKKRYYQVRIPLEKDVTWNGFEIQWPLSQQAEKKRHRERTHSLFALYRG